MAYILVAVGSDYKDTPNELGTCAEDVKDIAHILAQGDFNTSIFTEATTLNYPVKVSGSAVKSNILVSWRNAITSAKPGDKVILYYSGHGTQATDESATIDCLVPFDAVTSGLASSLGQACLITSYELYDLLIKTPEKVDVLFIADLYFSSDLSELQNQTKGQAMKQAEPFKHLIELLKNAQYTHGNITIMAGSKDTGLGTKGPLTNALIAWINQNGLMSFLSDCWTNDGKTLPDLESAISKTVNNLQVFYTEDTYASPCSSPLPFSPFSPVKAVTWDQICEVLDPLYTPENGQPSRSFAELITWLTQKYLLHKQSKKLPFQNSDLLALTSPDIQSLTNDEYAKKPAQFDEELNNEPFNVEKFLGMDQIKPLTPSYDNIGSENTGGQKTKQRETKKDEKRKKRFKVFSLI